MSNSRTFGVGETWWARSISPSVVLPIAETVPTTLQAALLRVDEPPRDVLDLVGVGDRRAAELHHDGVELGCVHEEKCRYSTRPGRR